MCPSLKGQQNYIAFGACQEHCKLHVRRPAPDEVREPEWRVVNPDIDNIEDSTKMSYKTSYPDDSSQLYYWRPTYWRRTPPK
jgi:hypothetical protein